MRNAVLYKGVWLMKSSDAYKLYEAGDMKKLDAHMKLLDQQYRALHGLDKDNPADGT